jgi:hypothetical protein
LQVGAAERPDLGAPAVAHLRDPVGVADQAAADRDEVEVAALEAPHQVADPAGPRRPGLLAGQRGHDVDVEADAADGDHRGVGERLHPAGQAEVGARPLRRPEPAGGHVEQVGARRPEDRDQLGELRGAGRDLGLVVRFLPLRDPDGDRVVRAGRGPDRRDHRGGERSPVGDARPAVAVGALVRLRPQELVEQVAVAGVDLDAVGADVPGDDRAAGERVDDLRQLGGAGGPAERLARLLQA